MKAVMHEGLLSLNGTWDLREDTLHADPHGTAAVLCDEQTGWIPAAVPGSVIQALVAAGRAQEPLQGVQSFLGQWIEHRAWWFRRVFDAPAASGGSGPVELSLHGLDARAEVFLNEHHLGSHRNAFRPFLADLRPFLKPRHNVLLIRMTCGLDRVPEAEMQSVDRTMVVTEAARNRHERGDPRRIFLRKPQYAFGWDWCPRVPTVAIAGDVRIRSMQDACIRHVRLFPRRSENAVEITATVLVENFHDFQSTDGRVRVALIDRKGRRFLAERAVLLRSGYCFLDLPIPISAPRLWWPSGMGEQHLYRMEASLDIHGRCVSSMAFAYGIRFVELESGDAFALRINGRSVFARGANWVPADAVYARVEARQYDALVESAGDANLNMLRVWGGGLYEHDAFYHACDRRGIMIWQDFMFACAPYPDHLAWFREEVAREAEYQTQRLRHHPCVVLWCGNNENHEGFHAWWKGTMRFGAWLYNYLLPETVQKNCPEIPYWPGSPYGGEAPNGVRVGDHHHWRAGMMHPDVEKRITPSEYDRCGASFVSEFGYIGDCSEATVREYMGGLPMDRNGEAWRHHTNTFENGTVDAGIRKHYAAPEGLSMKQFLLYSGLCQGQMLEYAIDSMRYRKNCCGSLFWMYHDCWGESGWSVMDYYHRRKPSWYFVRRAYAPMRLILRPVAGGKLRAVLVNDTSASIRMEVEYGYMRLNGEFSDTAVSMLHGPPYARTEACIFPRKAHDPAEGVWFIRPVRPQGISAAIFRGVEHRHMRTCPPGLSWKLDRTKTGGQAVRLHSRAYAHAVFLDLPQGLLPEDDFFDLLPNETRVVPFSSSTASECRPENIHVGCAYPIHARLA